MDSLYSLTEQDKMDIHPATKEQRDLLFQKMKEAGYEWDADEKELKMIEQKPAFCHHEVDLSGCSEEYRKAYYDGWNNCNQQHAQLEAEQKPAWSEKDEKMLKSVISSIRISRSSCEEDDDVRDLFDNEIDWLESLKERYTWKPSDEQMEALDDVISARDIKYDILSELWKNLKKLKED